MRFDSACSSPRFHASSSRVISPASGVTLSPFWVDRLYRRRLSPARRVRYKLTAVLSFLHDRSRSGVPAAPPPFSVLRKGLTLLIQVAGLLATGWMIWATSVSPRLHRYSLTSLAGTALGFSVFAWSWSVLITFGLYLTIPRRER